MSQYLMVAEAGATNVAKIASAKNAFFMRSNLQWSTSVSAYRKWCAQFAHSGGPTVNIILMWGASTIISEKRAIRCFAHGAQCFAQVAGAHFSAWSAQGKSFITLILAKSENGFIATPFSATINDDATGRRMPVPNRRVRPQWKLGLSRRHAD